MTTYRLDQLSPQEQFTDETEAILTDKGHLIGVTKVAKGWSWGWELNIVNRPVLTVDDMRYYLGATPMKVKTFKVTISLGAPIQFEVEVQATSENWAVEDAIHQARNEYPGLSLDNSNIEVEEL